MIYFRLVGNKFITWRRDTWIFCASLRYGAIAGKNHTVVKTLVKEKHKIERTTKKHKRKQKTVLRKGTEWTL